MKNKTRTNGFTLAETLITLGIVGAVAAMTLPTLVKANQNRVNEARYKKAVSMLSQAAQLAMAEVDSPGNMTFTDLWNCKNKENVKACYKTETKKLFKGITLDDDTLINKMKTVNYNEIPNPWGDVYYAFTTGDAMTFGYANSDEGLKLIVDTTSKNKPNKISQDLYALQVKSNGIVVDVTPTLVPKPGSECKNLTSRKQDYEYDTQWTECLADLGLGYDDTNGYYVSFPNGGTQEERDICTAAGGTVGTYWDGIAICQHPD